MYNDNKTERTQVLTAKQEKALFELYNNGSENAKSIILEHNVGLVQKMAGYYAHYTTFLEYEDLFQEGYFGLMEAVERFDCSLGYRFSTYATKWIFNKIIRAIKDSEDTIRLTDTARQQKIKIIYITLEDFLEKEGFYINLPLFSEKIEKEEEEMDNVFLREQLQKLLKTLTPREEKVLRLRFGLDNGKAMLLEEVGKEFSVTRERIRLIEAKALRKLRHPSRSKQLKEWLG